MNTIMMTTYLAGAIMGQASFGSMDKCKTAAEEVMSQEVNGLSVVCTYQQDAKIERNKKLADTQKRFDSFFKDFIALIRELREMERENQQEIENNESSWSAITGDEQDDSNWKIIEEWTSKDEIPDWFFEGRPRCGGLAVEPNKWITDMDSRKLCGQS